MDNVVFMQMNDSIDRFSQYECDMLFGQTFIFGMQLAYEVDRRSTFTILNQTHNNNKKNMRTQTTNESKLFVGTLFPKRFVKQKNMLPTHGTTQNVVKFDCIKLINILICNK